VRISSPSGTGSGVIISVERGAYSVEGIAILTAAHVVENQSVVDIELYDSEVITGTVVITDTDKDLALVRIETTNQHEPEGTASSELTQIYSARLSPSDYKYYLFTPVWAVGCSLGLNPRPSFGHITSCPLVSIRGCEISAPILPGNSGGPVFDARTYEVIGIAVWVKVYDGQLVTTMAGVVPIQEIYDFLESTNINNQTESR
jgi:S1-C subfamily serine protease